MWYVIVDSDQKFTTLLLTGIGMLPRNIVTPIRDTNNKSPHLEDSMLLNETCSLDIKPDNDVFF